jgi:hypothetical protein
MHLPIWAVALIFQNFAFTFTSRARNSGSLKRHIIAAIFSNLIFLIQFAFMTGKDADAIMHGSQGHVAQAALFLFYTLFTVIGSVAAHYFSLMTEKGKGAVGHSSKYAQIPTEDWERIQQYILGLTDVELVKLKHVIKIVDTEVLLVDATFTGEELITLKRLVGGTKMYTGMGKWLRWEGKPSGNDILSIVKAMREDALTTRTISVEEIAFLKTLHSMQKEMQAKAKAMLAEAAQHNQVPAGDPLARPELASKGTDSPILGTSAKELIQ